MACCFPLISSLMDVSQVFIFFGTKLWRRLEFRIKGLPQQIGNFYKFSSKDAVSVAHETKELPFLFDNREKTESKEFIECDYCGTRYPVSLDECSKNINLTILQKAIRSDYVDKPEFLG